MRTSPLAISALLCVSLSGCAAVTQLLDPSSVGGTSGETSVADLEKLLAAAQFTHASPAGVMPSVWETAAGDVVSLGENLGSGTFITVKFPEGNVTCSHIGDEPSGPNPVRFVAQLKTTSYGNAITKPGCKPA